MRIGKRLAGALMGLGVTALGSCAATMGGGPFFVPIDSTPSGATVSRGTYSLGVTPCLVQLTPRSTVVQLTLEGYAERTVDVGTVSNVPLMVLGFLFWGPIELIAAGMADAIDAVDTRPVHVFMSKEPRPRWDRENRR